MDKDYFLRNKDQYAINNTLQNVEDILHRIISIIKAQ